MPVYIYVPTFLLLCYSMLDNYKIRAPFIMDYILMFSFLSTMMSHTNENGERVMPNQETCNIMDEFVTESAEQNEQSIDCTLYYQKIR